ncbi:MAG: molybdenum ABC transporter ATP-binding protein [Hyphomicrobium sp.]|nr:molybdenum ABC transporter ATP-binding protein [Hyphomicrobium sp.]
MIDVDVHLQRKTFCLNASFTAGAGITALFGPSGSGKSTLLALIAGLVRPTRGRIAVDGRTLVDTERKVWVPKHKRRIGIVFQDAQLFPHMTVGQNLNFGRWFAPGGKRIVSQSSVVDVLGISHLTDRRPPSLSGGERQRVALARALLSGPEILLLDEPLASLDAGRREEILPLIERMRDEFRIPMLYVTHDASEVNKLASQAVVLENGQIVWKGRPGSLHSRPELLPDAKPLFHKS